MEYKRCIVIFFCNILDISIGRLYFLHSYILSQKLEIKKKKTKKQKKKKKKKTKGVECCIIRQPKRLELYRF